MAWDWAGYTHRLTHTYTVHTRRTRTRVQRETHTYTQYTQTHTRRRLDIHTDWHTHTYKERHTLIHSTHRLTRRRQWFWLVYPFLEWFTHIHTHIWWLWSTHEDSFSHTHAQTHTHTVIYIDTQKSRFSMYLVFFVFYNNLFWFNKLYQTNALHAWKDITSNRG